ncbi:hypothetical protein [Methanosarcina vacuolata]|uniref:hypothetical protein n=1 Tax=Methanosarcina vacuolata TaxID=2215 RepID=UPI00064E29A2|nr:hypothetical protein [Methanosarcina vacuolata]
MEKDFPRYLVFSGLQDGFQALNSPETRRILRVLILYLRKIKVVEFLALAEYSHFDSIRSLHIPIIVIHMARIEDPSNFEIKTKSRRPQV